MFKTALSFAVLVSVTGGSAPAAKTGAAPSCISADRIVTRRAVSPDTVEFAMTGGRTYRSTVSQGCQHLAEIDRTYVLQFEAQQGQRVCGGDRFRLTDPVAARSGGGTGFPFCRFGRFVLMAPAR